MTRGKREPLHPNGRGPAHAKAHGAGATSLTLAFLALALAVQRLTRSAQRRLGIQRRSRRKEFTAAIVLEESLSSGTLAAMRRKELAEKELNGSRDEQRRLMLGALAELLDHHPSARAVMRHLALVELALRRPGLVMLEGLSSATVKPALAQLEGLVGAWSPALAMLRSAMAAGVMRLEATERSGGVGRGVSSVVVDDELQVNEVGVSSFVAAEHEWAAVVEAGRRAQSASGGRASG